MTPPSHLPRTVYWLDRPRTHAVRGVRTRPLRGSASRGLTLLELLIVISIMALVTVGVSFAVREQDSAVLDREALRLVAVLEAARAQARASGVPVVWRALEHGFVVQGLTSTPAPQRWLDENTLTQPAQAVLVLGPEPIIGPQEITLARAQMPGYTLRIRTDGLRPFAVVNALQTQE